MYSLRIWWPTDKITPELFLQLPFNFSFFNLSLSNLISPHFLPFHHLFYLISSPLLTSCHCFSLRLIMGCKIMQFSQTVSCHLLFPPLLNELQNRVPMKCRQRLELMAVIVTNAKTKQSQCERQQQTRVPSARHNRKQFTDVSLCLSVSLLGSVPVLELSNTQWKWHDLVSSKH